MSEPYLTASASQPRRITRLARKPIKLASSAIRPLRSSSSTSSAGVGGPSGAAAAGMGSGGTLNASGSSGHGSSSGGGSLEAPSSGSSSLNPLKRITSRSRNRESLAPGTNANASAIESGAELDGTAIVKSVRGPRKPLDGEEPAAVVRVRVVKADGLVARDRNGSSDPYVSLLLAPSARQSTHHLKKTLSPVYPAKESTFDFPLYMSMASVIAGRGLEAVVWDKDMLGKDYMGELSLPMKEWFPGGTVVFMHDDAPMVTRKLVSSRRKQDVTGTLTLQIGFVPPKTLSQAQGQGQTEAELDRVKKVFQAIVEKGGHARSLAGVLGVPAHKGIGTIKLRNRRKSSKDLPLPGGSGSGAYTIGALTSQSAAVIASMAAGKTMIPVSAQQDVDEGDDDDDAASLADDGLSSSSSDGEDDVDSTDDVEALAESPDATPFAGQTGAVPLPKHHQHDHAAKRRSTDQSASSVNSASVPPLSHRQSGYFDRIRRESSPQDLTVPSTPGTGAGAGTGTASGATTPGGTKRPFFLRGRGSKASSASLIDRPGVDIDSPGKGKKQSKGGKGKRQSKKQKKKNFNFDAEHGKDILGIVVLEIQKAEDLPRIRSTLKLSYDSDPFVVISYGKKVFRTRVIRHSLNPVWDEKMLFHVRRNEQNFTVQFSVLDWDNMSGNDYLGACTLPLSELMADAPKPGANGLYEEGVDGKHDSREFRLPIVTEEDVSWKSKHSPHLTFRAKYEPYDALRQKFWRQYIAQYDVDGNHSLSYTELSAMLDSLGSTLTHETIEGFFKTSGKTVEDELTMEEVILHLESEVNKPRKDRAKVSRGQSQSRSQAVNDARSGNNSGTQTPDGIPSMAPVPAGSGLSMAGPQGNISAGPDPAELTEHILESTQKRDEHDKPGNLREADAGAGVPDIHLREASADGSTDRTPHNGLLHPSHAHSHAGAHAHARTRGHRGVANPDSHMGTVTPTFEDDASDVDSIASDDPSDTPDPDVDADADGDASSDDREPERVINIRTCPLCHRSRLKKKSEQDIITHLAICASADWSRVDRIVTANYVTSSQAQRKFLTRMMNKVAIGAYSLGANSANILVQDRITGQLQEEKMAVYVRLGIRVLYKGWKTQIAGGRAKRLLKSMSIKQGIKYDSPESKADILPFIAFHNLNLDEILDPLDSFKTFNEFFYRKLKPEARPVEKPGEEGRLVSCADCRMMAFETVDEATRIWIKGREFGVGRLLGDEYKDVWGRYDGGALAIFRLAPQDYHRFHSPVKGRVGKMTLIDGEYYTVNPQAIRTHLDVYGENVRKVVPIETEEFGTVMTVWVGAMMVGSIATTVEEGQIVERGEELGYFAFGGSTIVCLFEKGAVEWDEDLKENGQAAVETLVRMGMGIGISKKE